MIFENINYFEELEKRIDVTKDEFVIFLQSIPEEDITFNEFDISKDPMGGFIQEIRNILLYSYGDKYKYRVVIIRGPIRTDSPTRVWQTDGLAYMALKRKRD